MKRVLLVAYSFPPEPSAGSLRPGYLARYLPAFGWSATVLTHTTAPPPFPADVVRAGSAKPAAVTFESRIREGLLKTPKNLPLRAIARTIRDSLLVPDVAVTWVPGAIAQGIRLLREQRFDAILTTAHPPSVHLVGWWLAKRTNIPWIADYRDAWTGNPYLRRSKPRQMLEASLERMLIRRASAVSTVSDAVAQELRAFHHRDTVSVIPNGYDAADWNQIEADTPSRFDLCFTGSMYDGKRSPDLLFEALAQMRADREPAGLDARVQFYGPNSEFVVERANAYGLGLVVRHHGIVSRAQAMRRQKLSAALLIFLNSDPKTASEMGSKYLEYIGSRRPLLAFGPSQSAMRTFLTGQDLGWFASTIKEAERCSASRLCGVPSGAIRNLAGAGSPQRPRFSAPLCRAARRAQRRPWHALAKGSVIGALSLKQPFLNKPIPRGRRQYAAQYDRRRTAFPAIPGGKLRSSRDLSRIAACKDVPAILKGIEPFRFLSQRYTRNLEDKSFLLQSA